MGLLSALGLKSTKAKKANQRVLALQEGALGFDVELQKAAADPSSQQFQQIFKFLEQGNLRDFEQALRQIVTQSNRNIARGGRGLINPERRDESFLQALARERETAGDTARRGTFDILSQLSGRPSAGIGATIDRQRELGSQQLKRATGSAKAVVAAFSGGGF